MTSRPTVGVLWTRVEMFLNGSFAKEWSNIFWFQQSAPIVPAQYGPDAIALHNSLGSDLQLVMADVNEVIGSVVTFNNGTSSYGVEVYQEIIGALHTAPIPEDISCVVQRNTATGGPYGRGRVFIAGLAETLVQGSYLSAAGLTAFGVLSLALATPIVASQTYTPYFFSPKSSNFLPTTTWNTVNLLATTRRRRPRF